MYRTIIARLPRPLVAYVIVGLLEFNCCSPAKWL
jgi:hypothetical protein